MAVIDQLQRRIKETELPEVETVVEVDSKSILMLSVAVVVVAAIIIIFNKLAKR